MWKTAGKLLERMGAWASGFFEEGTGHPSSKRLQAIAAQAVALGIICAFAGAAVGLVMALRASPEHILRALAMLLSTIETLTGMTLLGGGIAYLGGKGIERGRNPSTSKPQEGE